MSILKHIFTEKAPDKSRQINQLYDLYKDAFIPFALKNYPVDKDTACDIYQESFLAMCENIRDGQYEESNVSLKTYLFQIGRHKIYHHLRDSLKEDEVRDYTLFSDWIEDIYAAEEWAEAQEIAYKLIHEAADRCGKILTLYYWEKKKMKEIAREMNFKNEQVAKNKKNTCMKKFTSELKKRLKAADIHWRTIV